MSDDVNVDYFKILVQKIIKLKYYVNEVITIILDGGPSLITPQKLVEISHILFATNGIKYFSPDKGYIANKIINYIQTHRPDVFKELTLNSSIADIGGGSGELLQSIANLNRIPNTTLLCIESDKEWAEPYAFSLPKVKYLLWNGASSFHLPPQSLNVVLATVSLHHMEDNILSQLMENLQLNAKVNSLLIIKEHDCVTDGDRVIIDWEHHLYHITQLNRKITVDEAERYLECPYTANFKSKKQMNALIESHKYKKIDELNRHMGTTPDTSNPTKLYWAVYQKV